MATLLSGWRIRLFDSAGKPLYPSRVYFYDSTTSLAKTVYADREETVALGTYVDGDIEGYLPSVWLANGLYKADVKVKIQSDPETWKSLWTINDLGIAESESLAGQGVLAFCQTVAEMKAIHAGTVDAVLCAGYYTPNDCDYPLFFTYKSDSSKTDDGGAYIRPSDTAVGTAGRYHQQFPSGTLDIRRWGGIPDSTEIDCNGAFVAMGTYASSFENFTEAPRIGFIKCGMYNFLGDVHFNKIWVSEGGVSIKIPYFIGQGCQIGSNTSIKMYVENPTVIDSDWQICEYPVYMNFSPGSVPYLRPQWVTAYVQGYDAKLEVMIAASISNGIPIKVYGRGYEGEIVLTKNIILDTRNKIIFDAPDLIFTSSVYTMVIKNPIEVVNDHHIFNISTVLQDEVTVEPIKIAYQQINASWFGYGSLSTTDQGSALNAAISAATTQEKIFVPTLRDDTHNINIAIVGYINGYSHCLIPETVIPFGASGSISGVSIQAPFDQIVFSGTLTNILLTNEQLSPKWFGALEGDTVDLVVASTQAIQSAMISATKGRNVLDGGGCIFYTNVTVNLSFPDEVYSDTLYLTNVRNLTLAPATFFNPASDPYMLRIEGQIFVNFEKVDLNPRVEKSGIKSLYLDVYEANVDKCTFSFDTFVNAWHYNFVHTKVYSAVSKLEFCSPRLSANISDNFFYNNRVDILGDSSVQSGYSKPMIQGINFTNNTCQTLLGEENIGCLFLSTQAAGTLVQGVNICDNIFSGNSTISKTRISSDISGGAFLDVSQETYTDGYGRVYPLYTHKINVKNNVTERNLSSDTVENYCPSTEGFWTTKQALDDGHVSTLNGFRFADATLPMLPYRVFTLSGDTKSRLDKYDPYIQGFLDNNGFPFPFIGAACFTTYPVLAGASAVCRYDWHRKNEDNSDGDQLSNFRGDNARILLRIDFKIYGEGDHEIMS
jgi:hypothetical protein